MKRRPIGRVGATQLQRQTEGEDISLAVAASQASPLAAELHALAVRLLLLGYLAGLATMGLALLAAGWRP